jgi:hypothetical protein
MGSHRGFRKYRGGKSLGRANNVVPIGVGEKHFGPPRPKNHWKKIPEIVPPTVTRNADAAKVADYRLHKPDRKTVLEEVEAYKRYQAKWVENGKKTPFVQFQKWRELRNK